MKRKWVLGSFLAVIISISIFLCLLLPVNSFSQAWEKYFAGNVYVKGILMAGTRVSVLGANPFLLEGATNDAFETTIAVTDPSADRTIILPNATGEVSLLGQTVGEAELNYLAISMTVVSGATEDTASVLTGSKILGYYPVGNQDQFVDNIAISGTTLTLTLAANATNDNVFKVVVITP